MMPGENRRGAAMGAPGFGEGPGRAFARPLGEAEDLPAFDLHGEIAGRPDVATAFGEQQVDFRRPAANALDRHQLGDRLFIVLGQGGEVKPAGCHLFGQAPRIGRFLTRQPDIAQLLVRQGGEPGRIGAAGRLQPAPDGVGRLDADLLANDRSQQRFMPARANPRGGVAGALDCLGEGLFAAGQGV